MKKDIDYFTIYSIFNLIFWYYCVCLHFEYGCTPTRAP